MQANRFVLIRDFLIFAAKLWVDGVKDLVLIVLSIAAVVVDLFFGGTRKRLFYGVMRIGERIDLWLNLHGALSKGDGTGDGLFGASRAGSKTMLGQLEQAVRGGDEPRSQQKRRQ
jgi:hypothetical protein